MPERSPRWRGGGRRSSGFWPRRASEPDFTVLVDVPVKCEAAPRFVRQSGLKFLHRRYRSRPPQRSQAAEPDPRRTPIAISADILEEFPGLPGAMGEGFMLLVDEPDACAVSVVGPVGTVGVSFLRMVHPRPALLVVDYTRMDSRTAAACIDAGAAGYLIRPSVT